MTSVHCWLRLLKIAAPFTPKQNPDDANSAPPGLEGGVLKQMQRLALVALVTLVQVWMWGREGGLKATHQNEGKRDSSYRVACLLRLKYLILEDVWKSSRRFFWVRF